MHPAHVCVVCVWVSINNSTSSLFMQAVTICALSHCVCLSQCGMGVYVSVCISELQSVRCVFWGVKERGGQSQFFFCARVLSVYYLRACLHDAFLIFFFLLFNIVCVYLSYSAEVTAGVDATAGLGLHLDRVHLCENTFPYIKSAYYATYLHTCQCEFVCWVLCVCERLHVYVIVGSF